MLKRARLNCVYISNKCTQCGFLYGVKQARIQNEQCSLFQLEKRSIADFLCIFICVCRVFDIITSVSENNIVLPKGILFYEIIKAIIIRYGVVCVCVCAFVSHTRKSRSSLALYNVHTHSQWWKWIACINIINNNSNALIRAIFSFSHSCCLLEYTYDRAMRV